MVEYLLEARGSSTARRPIAPRFVIRISTWPSGVLPAPSRKLGTSPRNERRLSQRVKRVPSRTKYPGCR